jgi:hypothetical protein
MDELLTLIGNLGFPIAVSAYLLVRIEGKITDLTGSIHELRQAIERICMMPRVTGHREYSTKHKSSFPTMTPAKYTILPKAANPPQPL